jgi:hypothetical protein
LSPTYIFILRCALAVGAAWVISRFYFGSKGWGYVLGLAGFMLLVAYALEAFKKRRKL